MKKVFIVATFAAATMMAFAFTNINRVTNIKHTGKVLPNAESAMPYNFQDTWDFTGSVFYNECTGEYMDVTGVAHINIHGVYNPATNIDKSTFHGNFQGVKAVGETTGKTYQLQDLLNQKVSFNYSNCVLNVSYVENIGFKTAGMANNFVIKDRFSYALNLCTGEFTVSRDVLSINCQ